MTIKSFDRNNARTIQAEMLAAMKVVADRNGLTVRAAPGGNLSNSELTLGFVIGCVVDNTKFLAEAKKLGLDNTKAAEGYMLVGITDRPKNRWEVKKIRGGKTYIIDDDQAIRWFGKPGQIAASRSQLANDLVFGSGSQEAMKAQFYHLAMQLEPENLACDGERSSSQIMAARASINRQWKALEAQYGSKVTTDEAWGFAPKTAAH